MLYAQVIYYQQISLGRRAIAAILTTSPRTESENHHTCGDPDHQNWFLGFVQLGLHIYTIQFYYLSILSAFLYHIFLVYIPVHVCLQIHLSFTYLHHRARIFQLILFIFGRAYTSQLQALFKTGNQSLNFKTVKTSFCRFVETN